MAGAEFFQTPMGRRFFEATLPRIAGALEDIAKNMEPAKTELPWKTEAALAKRIAKRLRADPISVAEGLERKLLAASIAAVVWRDLVGADDES